MAAATDTKPEAEATEAKGGASTGRSRSSKKPATAAKASRTMTTEHKEALALGRHEGRVVNDYLDALEDHKPKRGRRVTPDTIRARIARLDEDIPQMRGKDKLKAIQGKIDLETQLRRAEDTSVITDLQDAFVKVAKSYADRLGITYDAYREAGVPSAVLREAGVTRRSA